MRLFSSGSAVLGCLADNYVPAPHNGVMRIFESGTNQASQFTGPSFLIPQMGGHPPSSQPLCGWVAGIDNDANK
jgi:hypothetical protein